MNINTTKCTFCDKSFDDGTIKYGKAYCQSCSSTLTPCGLCNSLTYSSHKNMCIYPNCTFKGSLINCSLCRTNQNSGTLDFGVFTCKLCTKGDTCPKCNHKTIETSTLYHGDGKHYAKYTNTCRNVKCKHSFSSGGGRAI